MTTTSVSFTATPGVAQTYDIAGSAATNNGSGAAIMVKDSFGGFSGPSSATDAQWNATVLGSVGGTQPLTGTATKTDSSSTAGTLNFDDTYGITVPSAQPGGVYSGQINVLATVNP